MHVRYWGGRGTNARYLCKGDYDDGGHYCLGFGGASVDRRLSQGLLKVISPFGMEASLKALEELSAGDVAQRAALSSKLQQLEYEAKKAFEQYDAVDARNRLVACELERRWNEKLEEIETTRQRLSGLNGKRYSLSSEEEARIHLMGENFAETWRSDRCPPTLKKMIFRTAIEEIIVHADAENKTLQFTIHWNGGTHTQLGMERPRSATETATPMEDLEIIRRMAVRHGDDQIASVLNRLGHFTGKGKRRNQNRVATVRRNYSISGQRRALPDPERVSLSEAARLASSASGTSASSQAAAAGAGWGPAHDPVRTARILRHSKQESYRKEKENSGSGRDSGIWLPKNDEALTLRRVLTAAAVLRRFCRVCVKLTGK
jgi:hypothetical protein